MTEDPTKDLTTDEMLRALLADMREVKGRLGALESAAEDRSRETRPKLDLIIKEMSDLREEMAGVRRELRSIDRKLELFNSELLEAKIDIRDFDKRLTELERRPG
jgi:chromosome segregation ATPase